RVPAWGRAVATLVRRCGNVGPSSTLPMAQRHAPGGAWEFRKTQTFLEESSDEIFQAFPGTGVVGCGRSNAAGRGGGSAGAGVRCDRHESDAGSAVHADSGRHA